MSGPVPDLKRNVSPPVAGSECCDCCEGIESQTPRAIGNPAGLSRIAYRVGDHAQFRASLHAALSSLDVGQPAGTASPLARLLTRDDADFTIGLIDAFACSADLLTFYQERIATESYLRTAVERVSVQEMGKLVGYELRQGLAAEAWLAFALETPPVPPPDLPPEPGNFVTGVPASLRLETGLKVQSVPGPDEKPQTFELVETLEEARPEWNAIRPWLSEARDPAPVTDIWLDGTDTLLKPGDGLLFVGPGVLSNGNPALWQFEPIAVVEPHEADGRTRVAWVRSLAVGLRPSDPASNTVVYAQRLRSAVFGSNAPVWRAMSQEFRDAYSAKFGTEVNFDWPQFEISDIAPTETAGTVDLDSLQPTIAADVAAEPDKRSFAVLARDNFGTVDLYRVTAASEVWRGEFAISAKVTRLGLAGPNLQSQFFTHVRATTAYAQSQRLRVAERPVPDLVGGDRIPIRLGGEGLLKGRRLIIRGTPGGGAGEISVQATLVAAHAVGPGRTEIEVVPALSPLLRRESVVVYANVALASHGESVSQILGSGAAGQHFQRFELKQLPLTYRAAAAASGAAAELVVRVGDIAWRERPTLFGAAPTDRVYTLKVDELGRTFVAFGDGVRGARLPSGINNVVARYRRDLGAQGNVAADTLTQLMTRPLGLNSVSNPLAADGGTNAEGAEAARDAIRRATRTLGRVVSVLDYEDFALAFTGIAKAQARVLNLSAGPTVAITLAGPAGKLVPPAGPVATSLLAALKAGGDPHVAVSLLSYLDSVFHVGIRVKIAADHESETVLAAVEAALRSAFSFDARALGQPVQQSEVIAVAQAVPGVVAVDLEHLYGGTEPGQQAVTPPSKRLLAKHMHVGGGAARSAELLRLDPGPLALLEEMP
ncbi:MAG TPA: putative baseplate assembly protein [Allosphingosinicella sp.]|nr:putative baseplate assembly protein [Allosphingosinicella sp.]